MSTLTAERTPQEYRDLTCDNGFEALRSILEAEQFEDITLDDAAKLGEALITFFEAFFSENEIVDDGTGTSS